jgi:hypothetical protein
MAANTSVKATSRSVGEVTTTCQDVVLRRLALTASVLTLKNAASLYCKLHNPQTLVNILLRVGENPQLYIRLTSVVPDLHRIHVRLI